MTRVVVHFGGDAPAAGPGDLLVSFDEGAAGAERASELLTAVEPLIRDAYVRWVADRSSEAMDGQGPGARRVLGGLPVWWLSTAGMKDNETETTFTDLCRLGAIDRALADHAADSLWAHGPAPDMDAVLQRLAVARGAAYESTPTPGAIRRPRLGRILAGRLALAARLLGQLVVVRGLSRALGRSAPPGAAPVRLLSFWPRTLTLGAAGPTDDIYRGLARRALAAGGPGGAAQAAYVGVSQARFAREPRRVRELIAARRRGQPLTFLEDRLTLGDVTMPLRTLPLALACRREARRVVRGGGAPFLGVDARELLDLPALALLARAEVAYHVVVGRLAERLARDERPAAVVSPLELYPFARALYWGLKRGNDATRTIAMQHALVTPGKLWYVFDPRETSGRPEAMPVPDVMLCQGEGARDLLAGAGLREESLHLTGSPRYDALELREQRAPSTGAAGRRAVLVLPSLDAADGEALVEAALRACARIGAGVECRVAAHPLQLAPAELARQRAPGLGVPLTVEDRPLYDALDDCDLAIASYSTAADEAIVRGVPVIVYAGLRPPMSSVAWTGAAPVARTWGELERAVEDGLERAPLPDAETRERHVRWVFHKLDGHATDRCLDEIRPAVREEALV